MNNNNTTSITNSGFIFYAPEPEALRVFRTTLFGLTTALSLVGNYVVCRAVWRHPGNKPFAHYLISNLAFAELLSTVCLLSVFHAYEPPWSWKLGSFMCKILEPLQIASLLVITTTLAIISFYRCLLMIRPLSVRPSSTKMVGLSIVTWVGSVRLSVPASVFRHVTYNGENFEIKHCVEVFPEGHEHYQDVYSIVLFIVNFVIPLLVMAICYGLVGKKIKEHIEMMRRLLNNRNISATLPTTSKTISPTANDKKESRSLPDENYEDFEVLNPATSVVNGEKKATAGKGRGARNATYPEIEENIKGRPPNEQVQGMFELENDVLKMVYVIVLIFAICYIPYQVQFLLLEFRVKRFLNWPHRYTFSRVVFTLTCLPSALHPVFYGVMSRFYRKAFVKLIGCRSPSK